MTPRAHRAAAAAVAAAVTLVAAVRIAAACGAWWQVLDPGPLFDTCDGDVDAHGYCTCPGFGRGWMRPPAVSLETTLSAGWVDLHSVDLVDAVAHDGASYSVVGESKLPRRTPTVGTTVRGVAPGDWMYVGVELGAAAVLIDRAATAGVAGRASPAPHRATLLSASGLLGASALLDPVSLGGELVVGVRTLRIAGDCEAGACQNTIATPLSSQITLRVRADLWLTPFLTAGLFVDRSARHDDASAGLVLAYHSTAFDRRHR